MRTYEVLKDKDWVCCHMSLVKKGDRFRLFEQDGTPVKDKRGLTEWSAQEDAVPIPPKGNFSVMC